MAAFEEVGVMPELIRAVEELGWLLPTPVQAEAVPLILGGGDVMAAAETGSGKTGAFALPVLQIVHETLVYNMTKGANKKQKQNVQCVLSADDKDAMFSIDASGLRCSCRSDRSWQGARANVGALKGKVYYEATVQDNGLCRFGWSTLAATLDLGTDRQSFGYGGTAKKSHDRQFDSYGEPFGYGDTIGVMLDCDRKSIFYSKNGVDFGEAFRIPESLHGQALYPAICMKNCEMSVNFGAQPFRFGPPQGFVALQGAQGTVSNAASNESSSGGGRGGSDRRPLCIILEPARDLAEQTHNCVVDFKKYLSNPSINNQLFVGGVDGGAQMRSLREGCDIVVGTPGRIIDLVRSGKMQIGNVRFFVLDEADRLLDTGNFDIIMEIFRRLPKSGRGAQRLQVLFFSATLHSPEVQNLSKKICQNPLLVDLKGKDSVPETVDHVLVKLNPMQDKSWLQSQPNVQTDGCHHFDGRPAPNSTSKAHMSEAVKILKPRMLQRIIDQYKMEQCLIFCRTNFDCDNLEKFLNTLGGGRAFRGKAESGKENPYSCVVLAGGRAMDERRAALKAFKEGDVRFLICTDVAARGIDIKELPYVINMTLPDKSEDYIHRIGRVGRADTIGLAISLVSDVPEKVWYCSVKGYKPWLDPKQQDVRTNEEGGHTTWYDEPQLLKDIEARLGQSISPLEPDLSLPKQIKERLQGVKYGQQKGGGASKETSEHLKVIQANVQNLAQLETSVQQSFLKMQTKWAQQSQFPALGR
eukprot:TRINITY_DN6577_c0_g1_i1.p1 TRINITY_DN6577_c0_g1~~TRINITY_DN6577_c0_g1_i1.p1  ORF type:complete len:753 (-),score=102.41 TRINITY_DN6577_c0_g1_i1:390-2648(-)